VQAILPDLRTLGCELVTVTLSSPQALAASLQAEPLPFPFVCDPDRTAYRALGLARGSWWMFACPRVLLYYLTQIVKGWLPRRPKGRDDMLQLGGDFVFDRHYRLVFAHKSQDPADRPAIADLLAAARATRREVSE